MAQAGEKKFRLSKPDDFDNVTVEWSPIHHETPEAAYISAVTEKRRKHFAQFFTPPAVAVMMAEWVSFRKPERVLEPSVGTGALVRALGDVLSTAKITCIDADPSPLNVAKKCMPQHLACEFICGDFLTHGVEGKFDAIIANPPYLRHHDTSYDIDIHAEIGRRNNMAISKACNLYVLFVLEICRLLSVNGRAAILVPADWLNANSASCLRQYFLSTRLLKKLLYFDESAPYFDDALTTSVVLLLENDGVILKELAVTHYSSEMQELSQRSIGWKDLKSRSKWNSVLLGKSVERRDGLIGLNSLAKTMRGVATGANEFFFLTAAKTAQYGISLQNTLPCIGSAKDISGLIFTASDFQAVRENGARAWLVNFGEELNECEKAYIRQGEEQGYHQRYLLARRRPWYKVEKRDAAPIWAASFGRGRVRFVWNKTNVLNLTTFHCIYPKGLSSSQIGALVCLLNSDAIQRRFADHLRVLGGGLLKFQPNDLLSIEVPDIREFPPSVISALNGFLAQIDKEVRTTKNLQDAGLSLHEELDSYVNSLILNFTQAKMSSALHSQASQADLFDMEM